MLKSVNILIVDDSKVSRQMLSFTLMEIGFDNILQAKNAEEALELLETEDVDAIITDLNMGEMNGMEMIKELRAVPRFKGKPIFLLTGEDNADVKKDARNFGATFILDKSDSTEKFKKVLSHYLER